MMPGPLASSEWITVCGGGNGAHALIGTSLLGDERLNVRVYLPLEDERAPFEEALSSRSTFDVRIGADTYRVASRRIHVTADAEEAACSPFIAMVVPAFAHQPILSQIASFLTEDHVLAVLPARSGFEYQARIVLNAEESVRTCFVGFQTLPWACRTHRFGQSVTIYGTKRSVGAASMPRGRILGIADTLARWLDVPVVPYGSMLELSLANTGQLIHPGIMYACFAGRLDEVFATEADVPVFYGSVNERAADTLSRMSDEVLAIKEAVESGRSSFPLPKVVHLSRWLLKAYGPAIEDNSSLARMFQTNQGYRALTVPVTPTDDGYRVDVHTRYLTEDLPFGLVVVKGIASIIGISTPTIDQVITHTSRWVGKEYLVGKELAGRDVPATRAPQRYGIHEIDGLLT